MKNRCDECGLTVRECNAIVYRCFRMAGDAGESHQVAVQKYRNLVESVYRAETCQPKLAATA